MKKIIAVLALAALLVPVPAFARQYELLTHNGYAKVVEIIDGDSLRVEFLETGDIALVRLIGVDAGGYDGAIEYLTGKILGRNVFLSFDSLIPKVTANRWNTMYVYCDGVLINQELLNKGYAKINERHGFASMYESLSAGEAEAKSGQIGVWEVKRDFGTPTPYAGIHGEFNINTASRAMLNEMLSTALAGEKWTAGYWYEGSDNGNSAVNGYWVPGFWTSGSAAVSYGSIADNIITYRSYSPIRTVSELKFVLGITKEIYDKIRPYVTVSTNILSASAKELYTLGDISQDQVNRILRYRQDMKLAAKSDLYSSGLLSGSLYDRIAPYIDITNVDFVNFAIPNVIVNINTATETELRNVGLSQYEAERVVNGRRGYTYKTLGELTAVIGFSVSGINAFADNFKLTDSPADGININTATTSQLIDAGLSLSQAEYVYSRRGRMRVFGDIPVDLTAFNEKITLYTNINAASESELESLSALIPLGVISDILSYRADQFFGSYDEIRAFFESRDLGGVYDSIREFIVIR